MNVRTVVVGVDASDGARNTLEWLVGAVQGGDVDVVVVHCLPPLVEDLFSLPPFDFDRWKRDHLARLEERWLAPLRDAGVAYRTRVVDFEPAEGLQRVADDEDADLVVVGSHGHGRFGVGAVPHKLVGHATRPVVVVPSRGPDPA